MFRRSRFSVRPNVITGGRTTAGTPQEPPAVNQDVNEAQKESGESSSAAAVADKSDVTPSENAQATGDGNDQNGEGPSSSASVQRRKRFSIKPKVAPGRPPTISRTPKSPVRAAAATPSDVSGSDSEKPSTSTKAGLQALHRRRPSETSKQHKVQPKITPVSSEISGPSCVSLADDSPEQTHLPSDASKQAESISGSPVKEVPPRQPDRIPPSLPDKEATEVSEKAKTLISSKNVTSMPRSALSLSRLLNDPSDVQRLLKAQKLRELLKQERCKERKLKTKARQKEFTLDPTKMTMRDLIHYLPTSNPMTSNLEDSSQENESVISVSPRREKSPERTQQPEVSPAKTTSREEEAGEENAAAEEDQEEALMVPQVKVAEDGSLIIDEESLTVEVQRAKGPNPAQDREPIFERGSTTTYSSFRKANYTKPWSIEETDMFFLAVSMVGTDFSMICQLFPHRARLEIKNKFKKEERENSWRIDKAFREKRNLDIVYFSKLLEKILEVQENRKKLKSLAEKNATKKTKTKTKRKKSTKKLSDVEEEDENEVIESEDGGEKENEEQLNEGEIPIPASEPKKKRTRKKKAEALTEEPSDKKTRMGDVAVPEDSEQVLAEDPTNSDISENAQNAAKDTAVKPAKPSRGRPPKPVLPREGLKRSKKAPLSRKEEEAASDKGEKSTRDKASKEQGNKEELDLICNDRNKSDDVSSEEEETVVTLLKPTRYGRVPKPTQPLTYPSQDDPHSSAAENTSAKPKARCSVKRGNASKPQSNQMSKKPKLIRSSKSDLSDEESEKGYKGGREEQQPTHSSSGDPEASVFMTSCLHPPSVEVSEMDESIVELDILDSMPDVLGISQDALCPDSSCQKAQHETGASEPCEHQLDLLVDVIDFLSSEHTEDSQDVSYNEAAQTLLTIGSLTPATLSAQSQMATQDYTTESTSAVVHESSPPEEDLVAAALELSSTSPLSPTLDQEITEISQTSATVELQSGVTDSTQPKPKLGQTSRTSQQISQTETLKEQTVKEIAAEEIVPKKTDSAQALLEDNISLTEIKPTVESSGNSPVTQSCSSSVSQFEPRDTKTSDSKDERSMPHDKTSDSGLITPSTSNSALTDAEQEPHAVPDPFHESSDKHPPCASPPEDLPASQKGEGDGATPSQSRGSRMQKLKPKPNVPRTSRATRNKSQETVEKDSLPTLKPEFLKQTVEEVEPQPTFSLSSGFKPTEELPVNKEIKTHVEVANQVVLDVSTSDQSATEKQDTSEVQISGEETTRDTKSASDFTDKSLTSHAETTEKSCKTAGLTDPTVTEPLAGQGSNADLNVIQEGSSNPTTFTASAEEKTIEETKVTSTSNLKKGRLQKIKPKPNVPQTSRVARSKPQATEEPAEKLSNAGLNVEFNIKTVDEVDQQNVFPLSSQTQSQSTDCSSSFSPVLMSDSSLTPTEKLSTNEEDNSFVELVNQMDVEEESDRSVVEITELTEVQPEQSKTQDPLNSGSNTELTDKILKSHGETSESDSNTTTTTVDSGSVESKIGSTILDSAPDQEQRTVEELIVGKEEREGASAPQLRRSRLAKIKPKPNLLQTSRSAKLKPQTTEKDLSPDPEAHKNPLEDEPQATCSSSVEKQADSVSGPKPSLTSSSSVTPSEEEQTCAGFVDRDLNLDTAASVKSVPENQNLEVQLEPNRDAEKPSEFRDLNLTSRVGKSEKSCDNVALAAVTQSQVDLGSSDHTAASITPSEESCASQEKETAASACQLRRSRSQKIKLKPNLPQISRTTKSKHPQVTKEGLIKDSGPTPASEFDDRTAAEVEPQPVTPEKLSEYTSVGLDVKVDLGSVAPDQATSINQNLPEMNANMMFHVGASERSLNDMETSDKSKAEVEAHPPEKSVKDKSLDTPLVSVPSLKLASSCEEESSSTQEQPIPNVGQVSSSDGAKQNTLQRRQRFSKVKPKPNLESASRITSRKNPSADDGNASANQHVDTSSTGASDQKSEESDKDNVSNNVPVETNLSLSGDSKLDVSTESCIQTVTDQTTVRDVQSTVTETTSNSSSVPHETDSSVQRADQMVSKLTDTTETSTKTPQARRGRLIKPKPNLRRSSRPQLSKPEQSTKPTEADSSSSSQGVDVSVDHKPLTELRPEDQKPEEGVSDKQSHKDSSLNDAHSSSGCVTQISTTQNESTPSAEGIQSYSLLSQIVPAEVPTDPDEPFFILSLTEIPVSSAGEVTNDASHLPKTDLSIHEQRVPTKSLEAARDGSALNVLVHTSTKESSVEINTRSEPAASISEAPSSHLNNDPDDEQGSAKVQPPEVPETTESNETETVQSKQTRKGKLQVKSTTTRKKRTSPAATLTESEPKVSDKTVTKPHEGSGVCADADKEALTGEREPDRSSASQTARSTRSSRRCGTPRDFLPFFSEANICPTSKPPSRKAACKKTKETTPSPAAKTSSSEPKVSSSDVVPTKSLSQPSPEARSTSIKSPGVEKDQTSEHSAGCSFPAPSIQLCTAEASGSLEDDCTGSTSAEEEPTSVSQYFLSDIFTEVEHG